jgi:hypothetical protein
VALLTPALPFVVPSSEVSLARISGLGAHRVGKFTVVVSILRPPQSSTDDCHGQSSLLVRHRRAAQKGAGSKPIERRHWVASLVVGILIAVLIAAGMFFLLVSQQ